MADYKANREEKDALFRIIFGSEHPENALSLYNAINNTDYTNVEDVTVTTLRDALYVGVRNDVSFLFEHDMNLYEHQSTYCPNMPLRGFEYFHDLIKEYLGGDEHYEERVYSRRLQSIPRPKYYVFYNGTDRQVDREDLRLSDAYGGDGDIEVVAHVINVNAGHNDELLKRCKPMSDYSELIHRLRENLDRGMDKEGAVALAIDSCIEDGILSDLLRKEQARVMSTLVIGLTEEQKERMYAYEKECDVKEAREEGRAEGREEGRAEGREEGREEGRAEGREEGRTEERADVTRVTKYLLAQNRADDLIRALEDEDFRAKILSEMNK